MAVDAAITQIGRNRWRRDRAVETGVDFAGPLSTYRRPGSCRWHPRGPPRTSAVAPAIAHRRSSTLEPRRARNRSALADGRAGTSQATLARLYGGNAERTRPPPQGHQLYRITRFVFATPVNHFDRPSILQVDRPRRQLLAVTSPDVTA